jgi:hypothetical protein
MTKVHERRLRKLEDSLNVRQIKRKIARVIYDPNICPQSDLPPIDADVILCLPDNGHRMAGESRLPSEGFLIEYS